MTPSQPPPAMRQGKGNFGSRATTSIDFALADLSRRDCERLESLPEARRCDAAICESDVVSTWRGLASNMQSSIPRGCRYSCRRHRRQGLTKSAAGDGGSYISYLRTFGVSLMSVSKDYAI